MAACAKFLASILQPACCMQADVHAAFGGVVPNLAMEAHKAAMDSCVSDALKQAGIQAQDLHAVAVSIGPGLSPCLQVSCVAELGNTPVAVDALPFLHIASQLAWQAMILQDLFHAARRAQGDL